jgi:hypothetical protein
MSVLKIPTAERSFKQNILSPTLQQLSIYALTPDDNNNTRAAPHGDQMSL